MALRTKESPCTFWSANWFEKNLWTIANNITSKAAWKYPRWNWLHDNHQEKSSLVCESNALKAKCRYVASGPLVRSSYRAGEFFIEAMLDQRDASKDSQTAQGWTCSHSWPTLVQQLDIIVYIFPTYLANHARGWSWECLEGTSSEETMYEMHPSTTFEKTLMVLTQSWPLYIV